MRTPLVACLAAVLIVAPRHIGAVELTWSNGTRSFSTSVAVRCTLLVRTSGGETALPQEWHLLWAADSADSIRPVFAQQPAQGDWADVCSLTAATAPPASSCDIVLALFCDARGGTRATMARYVLNLPRPLALRFAVVVPGAANDSLLSTRVATVNGGGLGRFPPDLFGANARVGGGTVAVSMTGWSLDDVRSVSLVPGDGGPPVPLAIVSQSRSTLAARATYGRGLEGASVEVWDGSGFSGTCPVSGPSAAATGIIVHGKPGAIDLAEGVSEAPLAQAIFASSVLRDSLASCGAQTLRRAFPSFRHSDVHAYNLIGEPIIQEDLADYFVAELTAGQDADQAAHRLANLDGILNAWPDHVSTAVFFTPSDSLFSQQWYLNAVGQTICNRTAEVGVQTPAAWDKTVGSPNVGVGIIDSGIDTTHVDLFGHARLLTVAGYANSMDSTQAKHGTAVAGIISAIGNNGTTGIAGTAYGAVPWGIKVYTDHIGGAFTEQRVANAISTAVSNALPVINMSIGFYGDVPAVNLACLQAVNSGSLVVAAMGNNNVNEKVWPAAYVNRTYAIGAVYMDGNRWQDSSINCGAGGSDFGPWIDAVAPGGNAIVTTIGGPNGYADLSLCTPQNNCSGFGGTSAAAAVCSGVAALLKSYRPTLLGDDLAQVMNRSAQRLTITVPDPTGQYGWGLVRADQAIAFVASPNAIIQGLFGPSGRFGVLGDSAMTPVLETFQGNVPGLANGQYHCVRHRMVGSVDFGWDFVQKPAAWGRASGTLGWSDTTTFDYSYEVNWARVVAGSQTTRGVRFETFVYDVQDSVGGHLAWEPTSPSNAQIAFTVIGPAPLTGVDASGAGDVSITTAPNPAVREVTIWFTTPQRTWVRLTVLDVAGRVIRVLANAPYSAGKTSVKWDVRDRAGVRQMAGVYFLRAEVGGRLLTKRFVVLNGKS